VAQRQLRQVYILFYRRFESSPDYQKGKMNKQILSSMELESYIRNFRPKGWRVPIHNVDFTPLISDEEFQVILKKEIPNTKQYNKWYVKSAIESWWELHGI
jgi:hypothetical protein